ncbi:MAG: tetratricopeptide repeat protein [Planctomycetota bacterium]|nr:MAG: tetratricopeptide repeat protein [Planctomycetota bacterium]
MGSRGNTFFKKGSLYKAKVFGKSENLFSKKVFRKDRLDGGRRVGKIGVVFGKFWELEMAGFSFWFDHRILQIFFSLTCLVLAALYLLPFNSVFLGVLGVLFLWMFGVLELFFRFFLDVRKSRLDWIGVFSFPEGKKIYPLFQRDMGVLRKLAAKIHFPGGKVDLPLGYLTPSLVESVSPNDEKMDLLRSLLVFARENLEVEEIRAAFAAVEQMQRDLADRLKCVRRRLGSSLSPEQVVQVFNHYFFHVQGFRLDRSKQKHNDLNNLLFPRILRRRRAYCLGLSALYLVLAERLQLPLYGVSLPNHFFVRYDDGEVVRNIETTVWGEPYGDEYYIRRYRLSVESVERGIYLANLRKQEVLVEFLNNRGNIYYRLGKVEKAIEDFNRATSLSINFSAGYASKGFVYFRDGQIQKAMEYFKKALRIDPFCKTALVCKAEIYMRLGRLEQAECLLRKVLSVDEENTLAWSNLALVYTRRGLWREALEAHQRALFSDPRSLFALNNAGVTYCKMGRYEEAIAMFQYALRVERSFLPARHNIVWAMREAGLEHLAREQQRGLVHHYRQLLKGYPRVHRNFYELARLLKDLAKVEGKKEHLQEAEQLIKSAISLAPLPEYKELLAELNLLLERRDRAVGILEELLADREHLFDRRRVYNKLQRYLAS